LNSAPRPAPEHLATLTDDELQTVFRNATNVGLPARVAAATVFMRRVIQRMGGPSTNAGLILRIPMGVLQDLEGESPERQAAALEAVMREMIYWVEEWRPRQRKVRTPRPTRKGVTDGRKSDTYDG